MKKMLEYQRLDIELAKMEKMVVKNDNKANLSKLKAYILDFKSKAFKLEESAKALVDDYENLKKQYQTNVDKIQQLNNTNLDTVTLDKVDGMLYQINSLSSELYMLERNINSILLKIKESLKNFEIIKKNMDAAKVKYNECKDLCDKQEQQILPKINEVKEKMKAMEKDLNQDLYTRYKELKSDLGVPVYVPIDNGHCGKCRVELPTAKLNKLKADGTIVCGDCHRIIFNK